jgi:hypothetical protein
MTELEHVEEIPDLRAVEGHIGVIVVGFRIGEIVPAAVR